MTKLESLSLAGQSIKELPPEIGKLTRLKELNLYANEFTELPEEISALTELEILDVDLICIGSMSGLCDIVFNLPKDICNLKKLKEMEIGQRKINQAEKEEVQKCLPNLVFL